MSEERFSELIRLMDAVVMARLTFTTADTLFKYPCRSVQTANFKEILIMLGWEHP